MTESSDAEAEIPGLDLRARAVPEARRLGGAARSAVTAAIVLTALYASSLGFLAGATALRERELFPGHESLVFTLMTPIGELLWAASGVVGAFLSVAIGPASGRAVATAVMVTGGVATGVGQGALVSGILYVLIRLTPAGRRKWMRR